MSGSSVCAYSCKGNRLMLNNAAEATHLFRQVTIIRGIPLSIGSHS
ncbi:hypothetical protein CZ787_11625 [Halomonas citrativorans]|uniref:Uncharacterized protein n=1 Tax=Halomonas citrativorans TaxID=2742612 RepID=A0A1R4I1W6_9GAMM|nr:hypothetical protein CZ787_11625 [Halomonas citrativorans]